MTTSLSRSLARLALSRVQQGLPDPVEKKVCLHIADAIGIALAARSEATIGRKLAAAYGTEVAGNPASIADIRRLAPAFAAFHTASLIHLLDFDDIHDEARVHPTAVTLPAALAVSHLRDPGAGVRPRIAEAVASGNELMCRFGVALRPVGTGPGSDWFLSQTFGYFAAALAAGITMDLTENEIVAALGLAYMQAAGGKEAGFGTGSTARAIYPGFAAMGGVHAAMLARAGIVGPETALDGPANFFSLYLGARPSNQQMEMLVEPEGWEWLGTKLKPFPCCRLSQPYVEAALALTGKVRPADIRRVVISVNPSAAKLCHPAQARRRPETLQDAKYSIPFMVAFSLRHGRVDLKMLNEDSFRDPDVLSIAERIEIIENQMDRPGLPQADIRIETAGGTYRICEEPDLSMDNDAARDKFLVCTAAAGLAGGGELWSSLNAIDKGESAIAGLMLGSA